MSGFSFATSVAFKEKKLTNTYFKIFTDPYKKRSLQIIYFVIKSI